MYTLMQQMHSSHNSGAVWDLCLASPLLSIYRLNLAHCNIAAHLVASQSYLLSLAAPHFLNHHLTQPLHVQFYSDLMHAHTDWPDSLAKQLQNPSLWPCTGCHMASYQA